MIKTIATVIAGLALSVTAGCSMMKKGGSTAGGGDAPLAGTMAEAPTYQRGASIAAAAECHTSGYAKLAVPAGEAFQLEVAVTSPGDEACVSFWYLKANGGAAGVTAEVCSTKSPQTFDVEGQESDTSFIQVSENGACKGAQVAIAIK